MNELVQCPHCDEQAELKSFHIEHDGFQLIFNGLVYCQSEQKEYKAQWESDFYFSEWKKYISAENWVEN